MSLLTKDYKHGQSINMIKEAVVLAGGLGTRLRGVVKDIPKPMAPIGERPFLAFLLDYLAYYKIERVVLSVGYKWEVIEECFGSEYKGMKLFYAVEEEPLGTGGGIANALQHLNNEDFLLLNGDTFFNVDLLKLQETFYHSNADLCLTLKAMKQFDRYGRVELDGNIITAFHEKEYCEEGFINGGVYVLKQKLFKQNHLGKKFSFEMDIMEKGLEKWNMKANISESYFIDIGIPEDYERAQTELSSFL